VPKTPPRAKRLISRTANKVLQLTGERSTLRPSLPTVAQTLPPSLPTVAQGWDKYAQRRLNESRVGDRWNNPRKLGMDVEAPEDVVPYLDRNVIEPFLGRCDVLLEIGPGGGRFTEVLLPRCTRLIAAETSPNMLELLRKRFPGDDRLDLQLLDGQGLHQVADDSIDGAFSYDVFVHLQHWDIYNYLTELNRVLKPGGKAVIHHSNLLSELGWKQFLFDVRRQLNQHKLPASFVANTPELMREFIARSGLECVRTDTQTVRRDCITFIRKPAA
jgi:SAM-dependent methyltransferase